MTIDDITENFHGGNPESVAAHNSVRATKDIQRERVVTYVCSRGDIGATCDESERALGLSHQACSARFTEAKARGQIKPSTEKRKTRSGRNAQVYVRP